MISYRCDRCGCQTTPDKLFEVELLFTPRVLDGGMNPDEQDQTVLGDLCAHCADEIDPLVQALVKPASTNAVDPPAQPSGTPGPRAPESSSSHK